MTGLDYWPRALPGERLLDVRLQPAQKRIASQLHSNIDTLLQTCARLDSANSKCPARRLRHDFAEYSLPLPFDEDRGPV